MQLNRSQIQFRQTLTLPLACLMLFVGSHAVAQSDLPTSGKLDADAPMDRMAILKEQLESGQEQLTWDEQHGWLPDLLKKLEIPRSSQTLVFSKTSQQAKKIRPSAARAIYFNDDAYLGYVQNGDFLEIATVDPKLGGVFYTLDQERSKTVVIKRDSSNCLSCHETPRTQNVPGFVVRSVYPKKDGHAEFRLGTTTTDHTTPFQDRFGGWYVTGNHGDMRHRGNAFVNAFAKNNDHLLDREPGANLSELPKGAQVQKYLEPTSDIVALMVLEHQSQFHNFVTQAAFATRRTLDRDAKMNRILERDPDFRSDSSVRIIASAADDLVQYAFFVDEFELTSPVAGNSTFTDDFAKQAIRDSQGRSLRDFDLKKRLLRYPCSYLVYSDSFCSMPEAVKKVVKRRMIEVLTGQDKSEPFQHLTDEDRRSILEILRETHPWFK
jgi:hypothetical protein